MDVNHLCIMFHPINDNDINYIVIHTIHVRILIKNHKVASRAIFCDPLLIKFNLIFQCNIDQIIFCLLRRSKNKSSVFRPSDFLNLIFLFARFPVRSRIANC